MNEPIVLIGGYGSHWKQYRGFGQALARVSRRRVFITNFTRVTWMVAGLTDYMLLVTRTHHAVQHAMSQSNTPRVILVGHSAGGIVARAYLADHLHKPGHTPYSGYKHVMRVFMLGSPLAAVANQRNTGLRQAAWLDQEFPGAFYAPHVQYLSVAGRLIEGKQKGTLRQRRAYANYEFLSGTGSQWGDGLVPISLSTITGVPHVEIEGVGHSPLWGPRWYGSDESIIRLWWHYFDQGDAPIRDPDSVLA